MARKDDVGSCAQEMAEWRCSSSSSCAKTNSGRLEGYQRQRQELAAQTRVLAVQEEKAWKVIYPQLEKSVRAEEWGGHWALLMPHLSQAVEQGNEAALTAIRTTLEQDYAARMDAAGGGGQMAKYWLLQGGPAAARSGL